MGLFSRRRSRKTIDPDERSPQTGVKVKDLLVLEQLVKAGADLNAPRHVVYYLYFDQESQAVAAGAEAGDEGFEVDVRPPAPESPQWTLVCERHDYVLSLDIVRDNTDLLEAIADRHSGDYDGWEASVA